MALVIMINKCKGLLLFFVNIFRRAMCCFRRRRKPSFDSVPLTTVGIISNETVINPDSETWNNWDDGLESIREEKPATVKDHIEYFRQQAIAARQMQQQEREEVAEDFFEDMTPRIMRQTKYVISKQENDQLPPSLAQLSLAPETISGGDLGEWEEGTTGWESEALDWDAQAALKEKRRLEREQRRQDRVTLGAKIS